MHYSTSYDPCPEDGYASCGSQGQHKEKLIITPGHFEQQCEPTYGCVAGCDCQHPCPEGQHCEEGTCVENPPTTCPDVPCEAGYHCVDHECVPDVCGADFTCDQGFHCGGDNTCVANPSESSSVLPACYQQDVFQIPLAPSCQGLGTLPTIPLISLDGEQLYISVTHDGPFSMQLVAHDPEPELLYNTDCTAVNYFKNSCNVQRLCSGGGTLSMTDKGTRDFTVTARPNFDTDVHPFQITITNHFVDFSKTTDGPVLDLHFARTMDTSSCRYWLNGLPVFTGL